MRMIQRGDGTRFALESVRKLLFGNLDRDLAVQACVARPVDFAHAARPNGCQDLVGSQSRACGQRHTMPTILSQTKFQGLAPRRVGTERRTSFTSSWWTRPTRKTRAEIPAP